MLVRRIARPLLASVFIASGYKTARNPEQLKDMAAPTVDKIRSVLPANLRSLLPSDPAAAVRLNGAIHVGAGTALALGKFPRAASWVLAGSMVPTTLAGHAFWQESDPAKKQMQQTQFLKNAALFGGLLIAGADTAGKPSVGWRGRKAAAAAGAAVSAAVPSHHDSSDTVESLKSSAAEFSHVAADKSSSFVEAVKKRAPEVAAVVQTHGAEALSAAREQSAEAAKQARKSKAFKEAKKAAKERLAS